MTLPSLNISFPQAILFDNDGVLVSSEPLHWQAWEKLLQSLSIEYRLEDIQRLVGKTGPLILTTLLDLYRPGWSPTQYDIQELVVRKNDFYLEIARRGLQAYPGVSEGLRWLRDKGVKLAVVSNAKRRELEESLKVTGLIGYIDVLISRDDVARSKPDPLPYLTASSMTGVEPSRCVAVEDSPPGLEAALMGNIPAVALLTSFPREVMENPIPGRPDLRPVWVANTTLDFFNELKRL